MSLDTILHADVVRPVFVVRLDILGDPLFGWTGPGAFAPNATGDAKLDGSIFFESEGFVEISDVTETMGIGGPIDITFAAGSLEQEALFERIFVSRRAFISRPAHVWQFWLSEDESGLYEQYEQFFSGVMTGADLTRSGDQPAIITVNCDFDLQGAKRPPALLAEHQTYYPGDTFATRINGIRRGAIAGADPATQGPTRPPRYHGGVYVR